MIKSLKLLAVLCLAASAWTACADRPARKADLPVGRIPKVVAEAAAGAVQGIELTDATRKQRKAGAVFDLGGRVGRQAYHLRIDDQGRILNVEADERKSIRPDREKMKAHAASPARRVGTIEHDAIRESSGVVASRRHQDILWTHNDQGNTAVLFAMSPTGKHLGEFTVAAPADDWEDVATDDAGHLYIANTGDNELDRTHVEVYRVSEPDPTTARPVRLTPDRTWRLRAPGGAPVNCESLFVQGEHGYVITKLFTGRPATLYRFPLGPSGDVALEPVGSLPITSPVTAADLSADGTRLAVQSAAGLYVFEVAGDPARATIDAPAPATPRFVPVSRGKIEGACFTKEGILMTSENRQIYLIPAR